MFPLLPNPSAGKPLSFVLSEMGGRKRLGEGMVYGNDVLNEPGLEREGSQNRENLNGNFQSRCFTTAP